MIETVATILAALLGLGLAGILLLIGALVVLLLIVREMVTLIRFVFRSAGKNRKDGVEE